MATRKEYVALATAINTVGDRNRGNADVLLQVAQEMAEWFAQDNERFNRAKFISACFEYQKGQS